jgi:cysteine desulfurase/selenocysteine lyase
MSETVTSSETGVGKADRPPLSAEVRRIRRDFPILEQTINGYPLAYLDNAATAETPGC